MLADFRLRILERFAIWRRQVCMACGLVEARVVGDLCHTCHTLQLGNDLAFWPFQIRAEYVCQFTEDRG